MSGIKKEAYANQIPGRDIPDGYIVLNLVLNRSLESLSEEEEDQSLSPAQRSVLRDLRDGDHEREKKVEKITSSARFSVEDIEGYYGSIEYSILLFNGDAFNVTETPNEIDRKIKNCYDRLIQQG